MAHHSHAETQTSLPDLLEEYLEELDDEELKKFKSKLSRTKYKELKPLPRGLVKGLDRTDLADKMINSYSEVDALNVMLEILKNMNLNGLAQRLNEDLQEGPQAGSELGDILEQNTIMSEIPMPSGAQGRKGGRGEEEKREKDRGNNH
ncbi:apoptosis-associated speck-like protein containing a CARD [Paramormyrops kingsleyae]|uniref:apoptosis-associated speck-like protein containing a CARD n=1 Tax=Paramormyrops kingsleyae TaxID=1676925 RepID=UPI003B96BBB0